MSDITTALAVAICALAVKLTDDALDKETDLAAGRRNLAARLGPGTMVYAALCLAVAASINAPVTLSLFFASYIVGMFNDLRQAFPSRLRGWQESALVTLLGVILFGWHLMLFSLLFILAVQLTDDCIDMHSDRLCGQRNFACRLGWLECWLAGLIALLAAWWLDEKLFYPVLAGTTAFYLLTLRCQGVKI
jgi:1,4-dihydroxy-2-naphthoate octaprenyltransferase